MKSSIRLAHLLCGLATLVTLASAAPPSEPLQFDSISGEYRSADGKATFRAQSVAGGHFRLFSSEGWVSVGFFDGRVYQGVFRYRGNVPPELLGVTGLHAIQWSDRKNPVLFATFFEKRKPVENQKWTRVPDGTTSSGADSLPAFDPETMFPLPTDSVYVEELPEIIRRTAPRYPDPARRAGIEGQVTVMALVRPDGGVGDLHLARSIPALDDAALEAVRHYQFKPARAEGKPIAVWVAVPVTFRLK